MALQRRFVVNNWLVWIVEAHHAGYSDADIRWILKTVGVWERIVEIVRKEGKDAEVQEPEGATQEHLP